MSLDKSHIFGAFLGFSFATAVFSAPFFSRLFRGSKNSKKKVRSLGFEMGGTGCKVALAEKILNADGIPESVSIINQFTVKTLESPEDTVDTLVSCIMNATYDEVGIAHFGPLALDPEKPNFGSVTTTPKHGWKNFPALDVIRSKLPKVAKKVSIDTDVNAAALAEFYLGGHDAKHSLVYITVGTGVGVGVLIDGKPIHGLIHPEAGHTLVIPHEYDKDFEGVCERHGKYCVEGVINNVSIAKRKNIEKEKLQELEDDDQIWEVIGYYLGQLCANVVLVASPEVIILGGGVMKRKAIYPHVLKSFEKSLNGYLSHPKLENPENFIKISKLQEPGLLGALVL